MDCRPWLAQAQGKDCRSIYLANDTMNVPTHLRVCPGDLMPDDRDVSGPWIGLLLLISLAVSVLFGIRYSLD